jgi:hypothetical protein
MAIFSRASALDAFAVTGPLPAAFGGGDAEQALASPSARAAMPAGVLGF